LTRTESAEKRGIAGEKRQKFINQTEMGIARPGVRTVQLTDIAVEVIVCDHGLQGNWIARTVCVKGPIWPKQTAEMGKNSSLSCANAQMPSMRARSTTPCSAARASGAKGKPRIALQAAGTVPETKSSVCDRVGEGVGLQNCEVELAAVAQEICRVRAGLDARAGRAGPRREVIVERRRGIGHLLCGTIEKANAKGPLTRTCSNLGGD
jgi:hypothetical protein